MKTITLSHGSGGKLTAVLIENVAKLFKIKSVGSGIGLDDFDDSATIPLSDFEIVLSTDSHVVKPIFFPGGDIGKLAVCGSANDVAVMGAKPLAILSAVVVEEGFSMEKFEKIMASMSEECSNNEIALIGGDTKVVEKGSLEISITTTCIGIAKKGSIVSDRGIKIGDKIIVSGYIGDHAIALLSVREGFEFDTELKSDVACVYPLVEAGMNICRINAMKDPTRGGLSAVLNEWASKNNVGIVVEEERVPIRDSVRSACEMLGLDPFMLASEGKVVFCIDKEYAEEFLSEIRKHELGRNAEIIGEVTDKYKGKVVLKTSIGSEKILNPPISDPIPRIC